jgi:Transposase DDE domain
MAATRIAQQHQCTGVDLCGRDRNHRPTVKRLALGLRPKAGSRFAWREGSAEQLPSRFARLRICVAHRDYNLTRSPEERLLIEWPKGEAEPTKYWFSTLQQNINFGNLVELTKLRWRIERDYQELKQEVGLGHFEERGWRGFHHHATLCIATLRIPDLRKEDDSPQRLVPRRCSSRLPFPKVTDPETPPLRPERNIPNSIATLRRRLVLALVKNLPRCPCCAAPIRNLASTKLYGVVSLVTVTSKSTVSATRKVRRKVRE